MSNYEAEIGRVMRIVEETKSIDRYGYKTPPANIGRSVACLARIALEVENDVHRYRVGWRLITPYEAKTLAADEKVAMEKEANDD